VSRYSQSSHCFNTIPMLPIGVLLPAVVTVALAVPVSSLSPVAGDSL